MYFSKETATTENYTYRHTCSIHDSLPIYADQYRDYWYGRAAVKFRGVARRAQNRDGRRRAGAQQAADHAIDLWRGADDGARGRGDRGQSRGLAPCGDQGGARRDRADQPQIRDRGTAPGVRRLSRRQQRAAEHVRSEEHTSEIPPTM